MPLHNKYDLFGITEEEYLKKLKFIEEGYGEKIAYIIYFTDDYNRGELKLQNMIVRKYGEPNQNDNHKIILKYFVTHLSLYDEIRKTEMEDFDYIKIEKIGYYSFTDFYKGFGIKNQIEKSLIEKIEKYDRNYLNHHIDIDEEEYLKNNTIKY